MLYIKELSPKNFNKSHLGPFVAALLPEVAPSGRFHIVVGCGLLSYIYYKPTGGRSLAYKLGIVRSDRLFFTLIRCFVTALLFTNFSLYFLFTLLIYLQICVRVLTVSFELSCYALIIPICWYSLLLIVVNRLLFLPLCSYFQKNNLLIHTFFLRSFIQWNLLLIHSVKLTHIECKFIQVRIDRWIDITHVLMMSIL